MSKLSRPDLLEELFELQSEECESEETLLLPSTRQCKRAEFTEASTQTMSKRPRADLLEELFELQSEECESEETLLLPSTRQCKRAEPAEASTLTMSKQPTPDLLEELFELQSEECESRETLLLPPTRQHKQADFTEASTPAMSKQPRPDLLEELFELQSEEGESEETFLLPSSELPEKINVPSEIGANSWPSASSTSVIGNNYHVFLSFRGSDTRKSFVDHLYHRLRDVGLKFHPNFVFRDDEDLPFGEGIAANLFGAIECSKVSIPVISENYAASEWCLRELIHIMECKESRGQIVLPVLYKVEPKDVKYLRGSVKKALESRKHWSDEAVKQQGREALRKAAESRVFESEKFADGREGELVSELVEIIMRKQQHDFQPHLPMNLVAIEDRVAEVMELVDFACPDTRIIGIWGMGGIGKTTLAAIIYKKLFDKFECRSILKDTREIINRKSIEHVQSLLISDITKSPTRRVRDSDRGIEMIRLSSENKKVLILLDDVDHQDHINNLIGGCNFKSGSRIIITCRDKTLLKSEYKMYKLKEMNSKESLLLFSRYAFEGEQPPIDLVALCSNIVATTGGLPLALVVIGSLLNGKKDPRVWRETLEKLRSAPDEKVQEKLRISFDTLRYTEQQMFLDIACFFIGTDKRIATYVWEDLKLFPITGLQVLINRSLIKIDDENRLRMHDQLRDLGKAIDCPENKEPWHWSRPWDVETMKILQRKEKNEYIEALHLDLYGSREFIKQDSFKRMPKLKFLHLSYVDFDGDFKDSLSELRWLKWESCPILIRWLDWMTCPDFFEVINACFEKLVILDLSHNGLCGSWGERSSIKMKRLKVLNLSWSHFLPSTPNLSAFESLEMLIMENCWQLEEIDPSIGDVKCLVSLNLRGCHKLKKLPREMGNLEELKELIIGMTAIKKIPPCIGSLKKLEMLDAYGCYSLDGLPDSISHLVNLLTLDLTNCFSLSGLPKNIGSLVKLQCLSIGRVQFPNGIAPAHLYYIPHKTRMSGWLSKLDSPNTGIWKLPKSIGDLKNLKILKIVDSGNLIALPSTIHKLSKLEELHASNCKRLGGEIHIDGLSSLRILQLDGTLISGFSNTIDKLSHLEKLNLFGCEMLQSLPQSIRMLPSLQHLQLIGCKKFQALPELPTSLTFLGVTCQHRTLPQLSHLIHLKELIVENCPSLESMPELPLGLLMLRVDNCGKLEELPSLSSLEFSSALDLSGCSKLTKIEGMKALKSLDAPLLSDDLIQVQGLDILENLEELCILCCKSLRRLDLSQLTHLKRLIIAECRNLVEIKGLERLKNLDRLDIHACTSIETLTHRSCFPNPKGSRYGNSGKQAW